METKIRFQPLSFSWVAIHPNPKGVVQFIGGAFFGTFPTVFYRYFLAGLKRKSTRNKGIIQAWQIFHIKA
jgi:hypothetical protein